MNKVIKPSEILKRHFEKLKKQNKSFSIRSLAQKLNISHSFLSRVLSGKIKPPRSLIDKLINVLKIDSIDASNLKVFFEKDLSLISKALGQQNTIDYESFPDSHIKIMRKWWNMAILDLITCDFNEPITTSNLHLYLPVPEVEIRNSIKELEALGLIKIENNVLMKSSLKVRFPARGPNEFTRAFYTQTLSLATNELKKTKPVDYENRLILGFTCAVNKKNIPLAKQKLAAALRECAETLADDSCDDVFIVQGQIFSILKN